MIGITLRTGLLLIKRIITGTSIKWADYNEQSATGLLVAFQSHLEHDMLDPYIAMPHVITLGPWSRGSHGIAAGDL